MCKTDMQNAVDRAAADFRRSNILWHQVREKARMKTHCSGRPLGEKAFMCRYIQKRLRLSIHGERDGQLLKESQGPSAGEARGCL